MKKLLLFSSLIFCSPVQSFQKLAFTQAFDDLKTKIKSAGNYCLDTVKSDLCIGDNITQHNSFLSQLGAGVRLACYSHLLEEGILKLGKTLETPLYNNSNESKITIKEIIQDFLDVIIIAPVIEEPVFTYWPNYFIRDFGAVDKFYEKEKRLMLTIPALFFASVHIPNGYNKYQLTAIGITNYLHGSYLLKRNQKNNYTPMISHSICNIIALLRFYLNSK